MLSPATRAAHHAASRFHTLDDTLLFALGSKPHDISRGDDVPLIGG
jgi:hypothetical protein